MSILVERPGLLTTMQDLGRSGYQHLGVSPGGVMDEVSHRIANLLVGNRPEMASLEITLAGPTLHFDTDSLIALCGGDLSAQVEGAPVPLWRPVIVRADSRLSFGRAVTGARCYLAVDGGYGIPAVMGSASTNLAARFGGHQGRPLRAGDRWATPPRSRDLYPTLERRFSRERPPCLGPDGFSSGSTELDFSRPCALRMIPGPEWLRLTEDSRIRFLGDTFRVDSRSNRMGIRLQGSALTLEQPLEMVSSGVATGTIQLPPDGCPILLMVDRQTTGGYPRLGELATVDLPHAAQLRPGETLRFEIISLEEAQVSYVRRETRMRALEKTLTDRKGC